MFIFEISLYCASTSFSTVGHVSHPRINICTLAQLILQLCPKTICHFAKLLVYIKYCLFHHMTCDWFYHTLSIFYKQKQKQKESILLLLPHILSIMSIRCPKCEKVTKTRQALSSHTTFYHSATAPIHKPIDDGKSRAKHHVNIPHKWKHSLLTLTDLIVTAI